MQHARCVVHAKAPHRRSHLILDEPLGSVLVPFGSLEPAGAKFYVASSGIHGARHIVHDAKPVAGPPICQDHVLPAVVVGRVWQQLGDAVDTTWPHSREVPVPTPASDDPLIDRYDTEQPKSPLYAAQALSAADPS
jgi:hypothetical protein